MEMHSNISKILKFPKSGFHVPEPKLQIPQLLLYDARNFHRIHQELDAHESAQAFLAKWPGYKSEGVEIVEEAFRRIMED